MERDDAESLKEFLAQQSDVGKTVVRSDHFTISPQKAWDKLSAHALPFKEAWVLEVVQAAVLANCTSIKVTQTTARTTLRLHREELWDPEQILEALLNFEAHSATYLHRLAVALRVLAKTLGHPFGVYTARRKVFGWTGDELEVGNDKFDLPEENSQVGDLIISVSNSANEDRSIFSKIFKLEERTFVANISALLYRRAFCCPIPLTVDSRSVRGLQAYLQPSQGCASRPLLLLHVPSSEKLPAFLAPSFESWEVAPADAPVAVRVNSESSAAPVDQTVSNGPALQFGQVGVVVVLRAFLARESTKDSFMQKNSKTSAWRHGPGTSCSPPATTPPLCWPSSCWPPRTRWTSSVRWALRPNWRRCTLAFARTRLSCAATGGSTATSPRSPRWSVRGPSTRTSGSSGADEVLLPRH